jgi:tetratricopeptide (TPR) repeat protein
MSRNQDIDALLRAWPYQHGVISARLVRARDGREVIQMRVEMGVMQMETRGRPDGQRPGGSPTYLALLRKRAADDEQYSLSEDECSELDREFVQYYHRRVCWLALREFDRAVEDADHTLAMMDFVNSCSADEDWALSHEQYRPFVLFHRTQASALAELERSGPETAIEEVTRGLDQIHDVFERIDAEEQFDSDELVNQLVELREWVRDHYQIGKTLAEQLADAVAQEQYELAARLRDEIAKRRGTQRA